MRTGTHLAQVVHLQTGSGIGPVGELPVDEEGIGRPIDSAVLDVDKCAGKTLLKERAGGCFILCRDIDIGEMDDFFRAVEVCDDDRAAVGNADEADHRNGSHRCLAGNDE